MLGYDQSGPPQRKVMTRLAKRKTVFLETASGVVHDWRSIYERLS